MEDKIYKIKSIGMIIMLIIIQSTLLYSRDDILSKAELSLKNIAIGQQSSIHSPGLNFNHIPASLRNWGSKPEIYRNLVLLSITRHIALNHYRSNYDFHYRYFGDYQKPGSLLPATAAITGFGIWGVFALTYGKEVTRADANMQFWNGLTGLVRGHLLNEKIWKENQYDDYLKKGLITNFHSIAEGLTTIWIGRKLNMDYSQTMAFNTGNIWGIYFAIASSRWVLGDFTDRFYQGRYPLSLTGSAVCSALLLSLHKKNPKTNADYRIMNITGLGAALYAWGIDYLPNSRTNFQTALLTTLPVIGLMSGSYLLTNSHSFTVKEANLITTSSLLTGMLSMLIPDKWIDNDLNHFKDYSLFKLGAGLIIGNIISTIYFIFSDQSYAFKKQDNALKWSCTINPTGLFSAIVPYESQVSMVSSGLMPELVQLSIPLN